MVVVITDHLSERRMTQHWQYWQYGSMAAVRQCGSMVAVVVDPLFEGKNGTTLTVLAVWQYGGSTAMWQYGP